MASPTSLTGNLTFGLNLSPAVANAGLGPTTSQQTVQSIVNWAFGTGAGQINEAYLAARTLGAGLSETLDLIGVLTGLFGETLSFARIKGVFIALLTLPAAASSITIGGASSNPWLGPLGGTSPTLTITSGDCYQQSRSDATGWIVNSGAQNLQVVNNDGANAATYLVGLLGATS